MNKDSGLDDARSNEAMLLEALKIAFCYMPDDVFLNEKECPDSLPIIKGEIALVRDVLKSNGVDPDENYEKMNPKITCQPSIKKA